MLGEREEGIRGADKAEVEGDLVEVEGKSFVRTMGGQDTTHETSQI